MTGKKRLAAIVLASTAASAQVMVDPARLPSSALKYFERRQNELAVRCEVTPVKPALNYGFRFGAGYVVHVPLSQYPGAGHKLALLTRITPRGGDRKPVYLMNLVSLPNVPPTRLELEIVGGYVLGQGKYDVEWTLFDETTRVCRKDWRIDATLRRSERQVKVAMPPDTVADYSLRGSPGVRSGTDDARPVRLTVLLHAAPLSFRRTILRASDKMMLLSTLSSLLERIPVRSLRLVVFNLEQQKEIFRQDVFARESLDQVTQSLNQLELGAVDYKVLKNRRGHVDLLADLMNQELEADEPADEVIFLGPPARFSDKIPQTALEKPRGAMPRFFYLQLQPFFRALSGNFPDSINLAVAKVKGKTLVIHTPGEFSNAIGQIERFAAGGK
jgi:hypothetical protein